MNKELLLEIADKLEKFSETAPDIEFDMDTWGTKTDCGTAACALGTAAIKGWIPGYEYKFAFNEGFGGFFDIEAQRAVLPSDVSNMGFELTFEEHFHLFAPDEYPQDKPITPQMVAVRIRDLVANDGLPA
jgi:hypothetical protein